MESLKPAIREHTLLILTTSNPLWAPLLRLASKLGLRFPESPRNFITNKDICSVLPIGDVLMILDADMAVLPKNCPSS